MMAQADRTSRRRGVAMVLVLGAVAVVFVVGMAILNGLPASVRVSSNQIDHAQALYLAECGLVEGMYRLEHPPVDSEVWSGIAGRSIDNTGGTYDVAVADLGSNNYRVTATAHMPGSNGQTVTHVRGMDVHIEMLDSGYTLAKAAVLGTSTVIPSSADIEGDAHVNSGVWLLGRVTGNLSAAGYVIRFGGSAGSMTPNADAIAMPNVDFDAYTTYTYNGTTGQAMVVQSWKVVELPSEVRPTTTNNPLGVVIVNGDMEITKNLEIEDGILVVRGDLRVNNRDLKVDGKQGYFSLLVRDDLRFSGSGDLEVNTGPAYLGKDVTTGWGASGMEAKFYGGLVAARGLPSSFNGSIRIKNYPLANSGISSVRYLGDGIGAQRAVTPLVYHASAGG